MHVGSRGLRSHRPLLFGAYSPKASLFVLPRNPLKSGMILVQSRTVALMAKEYAMSIPVQFRVHVCHQSLNPER